MIFVAQRDAGLSLKWPSKRTSLRRHLSSAVDIAREKRKYPLREWSPRTCPQQAQSEYQDQDHKSGNPNSQQSDVERFHLFSVPLVDERDHARRPLPGGNEVRTSARLSMRHPTKILADLVYLKPALFDRISAAAEVFDLRWVIWVLLNFDTAITLYRRPFWRCLPSYVWARRDPVRRAIIRCQERGRTSRRR